MSTVTTSIERLLTEPELAELGKQQARLLQEIGELVMQKKVAVDEFKAAIGEKQKQVEELSKAHQSGPGAPGHRMRCAVRHARKRAEEFCCRCHWPDR